MNGMLAESIKIEAIAAVPHIGTDGAIRLYITINVPAPTFMKAAVHELL